MKGLQVYLEGGGWEEGLRGAETPFNQQLKALYELRILLSTLWMRKLSHKEVKWRGWGQTTTRSLQLRFRARHAH